MQKVVPNIWCNGNAEEAGAFYAEALPLADSAVASRYPTAGLPDFQAAMAGEPLVVNVTVDGYRIALINAGPEFAPNPSISLVLNFDPNHIGDARAVMDETWRKLTIGGKIRMPLGEYPFSDRFGWVEDRYGVSWELNLPGDDEAGDSRPFVTPALLFGGPVQNRAGEALEKYLTLVPGSRRGLTVAFDQEVGPAHADALAHADFTIGGDWVAVQDAGAEQDFSFSPGLSLQLNCADQDELDRVWTVLSAVPEAEQCGWCVDEFGVSWQVIPGGLEDQELTPEVYAAMLSMKKIDIAALEAARSS